MLTSSYLQLHPRMMTADSIQLVQRCRNSFEEYFKEIPDDRLIAFAVNPLLATLGFADIIELLDNGEGEKLKERAMKLLENYILNVLVAREKANNRRQPRSNDEGFSESKRSLRYWQLC